MTETADSFPHKACSPTVLIAQLPEKAYNYHDALTRLGANCFFLPSGKMQEADALLLPGGGDIDPSLFGEADCGSRSIEPQLDRRQLSFLKEYVRKGRPVLGICKGMQLINVFFGGDIIQNLPTHSLHEYQESLRQDQVHPSLASSGSILENLYGPSFPINSAHHQGIGRIGKGLHVIQRAPDGVAEAIVHDDLPILGVQWHPERMCFDRRRSDTPDGSLLLAYFLSLIPSAAGVRTQ